MSKQDDTAEVWIRKEPDSPCIKICAIHPSEQICVGCYRTLDEIAAWRDMSDQHRAEVLADLPGRASRLTKRRGGRKRPPTTSER